jgi:hypothetical protein
MEWKQCVVVVVGGVTVVEKKILHFEECHFLGCGAM